MNELSGKIELRDIILGGQDGLVNILGLALGLFAAHGSARVILVAGFAAGVSEAVSMGAVSYTSATSDKTRLHQAKSNPGIIFFSSIVVGLSALIGSAIPLIPFIFFVPTTGLLIAIVASAIILFLLGVQRSRSIGGTWWRSGGLIVLIGMVSAFAGFAIGLALKLQ